MQISLLSLKGKGMDYDNISVNTVNYTYTLTRLQRHRLMRHLAYTVIHSVVPINISPLTIKLYSSVRTTLVYNDTKYSAPS
jgi:hypothetical protein